MVKVILEKEFVKKFQKIRHNGLKKKILIQIQKIKHNPHIGKPLRFDRVGTRELYISPYRLSYAVEKNTIYITDFYHKDDQ